VHTSGAQLAQNPASQEVGCAPNLIDARSRFIAKQSARLAMNLTENRPRDRQVPAECHPDLVNYFIPNGPSTFSRVRVEECVSDLVSGNHLMNQNSRGDQDRNSGPWQLLLPKSARINPEPTSA
jgi:hypothetical protein